ALLNYSEEIVNQLSDRAQTDQIDFALQEVGKAERRLVDARLTLLALQREVQEFNPIESAIGVTSIRMELESELAKTRTELESLEAVLQPNTHQLVSLRNKAASLERQIKVERQRLVSRGEGTLSESASSFEAAAFEKEFAEEAYQSTLRFLDISRIEAAQKAYYLSVLSEPDLPDEALYPERLRSVLTVFGVCLALFLISAMLLAVIREHARL
ncbi:MAG: hypothetical protein R3245_08525, partial [Kiloniellales bacterium]|nr:hypothetical protein [Kiloniellales bacterium]